MDGLKRARAMKADIKNNMSVLQHRDKKICTRRHIEDDQENQVIKTLRQEQKMSWNDIANDLNQKRRNHGDVANFTDAAIYSRFVRNIPRIATPVSEIGFDPKDYVHLRHPNQYTNSEGTGMISKAGKKRVKNYDNAKELEVNVRKQIRNNDHVELETAEKTEQLMEAVSKVERNFWVLVADEMERSTTKLYPPHVLASRYHAI
jgi:transcriptional regulator NrdR family protein